MTARLKVFEPVHDRSFVAFQPGEDFTMLEFLTWMDENDIVAVDDDQRDDLDESKTIGLQHAARAYLWCWIKPADAVLMRLRWADMIR